MRFALPRLSRLAAPVSAALLTLPGSALAGAALLELRGPLPLAGWPPFALTSLGLVAAAAAFAAWRRALRPPPLPEPVAAAPPREACAAALPLLERLAARYGTGALPPGALCLELAALVRSTLACRTGLAASRLTTGELMERMACCRLLPEAELERAGQLLFFCDRVKFAGHRPDAAEGSRSLALARELLGAGEETR